MRKIRYHVYSFIIALTAFFGLCSMSVYAANSHTTVYYPDTEGNFGLKHTCLYDDGTKYQYIITADTKKPVVGTKLKVEQSFPMEDEFTSFCALKPDDENSHDNGTGYVIN